MANLGLLGGIAQGIEKGMSAYQTERSYQDKKREDAEEKALKKRMLQLQMFEKGVTETPEGGFDYSDSEKEKLDLLKKKESLGLEKLGAETEKTKKETQFIGVPKDKEKDPLSQEMLLERLGKLREDKAAAALAKTPKGKLDKMGGEVKQKIGFITSALENVTNYEDRFKEGHRQSRFNPDTPIIGSFFKSTPIDESRTNLEEAIGRLASGGAINKNEEDRFRRMIPRPADSDEDAARKLVQIRSEMENKLTGYGFNKGELGGLGFDERKLGYAGEAAGAPGRGLLKPGQGLIPEAQAGGKIKVIGNKTYVKVPGGWEEAQ